MDKEHYDLLAQLINEKFSGVYSRIDANQEITQQKLNTIEEHTKRTNGRVNKLEDDVDVIKQNNIHRLSDCPQADKINKIFKIDEELNTYRFIMKNPKVFILGSVLFALIIIGLAVIPLLT